MQADWDGSESDRRLILQAVRERWQITDEKWLAIIGRQVEIASGTDPDATPKDSVLAFKTLLSAMQQTMGGGVVQDRRRTTVNIGAVLNADGATNKGAALLERFRAGGFLAGPDTRTGVELT